MFSPSTRSCHAERGSAAIVAVAIIVLVGFLGSALVASLRITSAEKANEIQAAQARYVADAGIEWACNEAAPTTAPVAFGNGFFEVAADGSAWRSVGTVGAAQRVMRCQPRLSWDPISHGLDAVPGSRFGTDQFSVEFLVLNSTDSPITFDGLTPSWTTPPVAYIEQVWIRVLRGTDYGKVWDYEDNERWPNGTTKQFTRVPSVTIPAHCTAEVRLLDFSGKKDKHNPANMSNNEVTVVFRSGASQVGQVTIGVAPN